jgi:exopolysaccharide production protein ExoZ
MPPADPTVAVTINTPRRLRGLDSLRGVAIAAVVLFHVQLHFSAPGLLGRMALLGYNGVQLFFIVSGITMCYMWSARKDESGETTKFLIRRLCRIAPPFWFAIAFYMLWRHTDYSNLEPAGTFDALVTALLVHGVLPRDMNLVVPGGWSIAVEAGFYILFPLMVVWFATASQRLWAALAIYLFCTACEVLLTRWGVDSTVLYYSLLTQLPIFVVAMALFATLSSSEGRPTLATLAIVGALWGTIALVGRALGWPTRPGLWAEVVLMLLFAAVVLRRLEWTFFAFLGRMSYSAYLLHFAVIDVAVAWLPRQSQAANLVDFGVGLAIIGAGTLAVAWMSSRTLEAWSVSLGRALIARLDASARRLPAA